MSDHINMSTGECDVCGVFYRYGLISVLHVYEISVQSSTFRGYFPMKILWKNGNLLHAMKKRPSLMYLKQNYLFIFLLLFFILRKKERKNIVVGVKYVVLSVCGYWNLKWLNRCPGAIPLS